MQKVLDLWELFHCREILPWHTNNIFVIPSYPFKHLEAAILL